MSRHSHLYKDRRPSTELLSRKARDQIDMNTNPNLDYRVGSALLVHTRLGDEDQWRVYTASNVEMSGMDKKYHAEELCLLQYLNDLKLFGSDATVELQELVVMTSSDDCPPPCGHCRQMYSGVVDELDMVAVDRKAGDWVFKYYTLSDLLPESYTSPENNGL